MSKLIAGVARANVTPPVGMRMSGYASRTTPAEGIHDELNTVAIYLNDGEMEAALITVDIIMAGAEAVARIREACSAASGVPSENIFVAFAHNHGGPQTDFRQDDSVDELKRAYATVVVHKIAGALSEAKKDAVPVRMGYGRQDCYFGKNRREHRDGKIVIGYNPDGPTSPIVDVLRLDRLDTGDPLSILFSYACHGTVMRADNLLYTAEFSGIAKTFIDEQFPTARSAFMAFCSADIDPWPHDKFEQVERYGRELGCAVVQAALDMETGEMAEDARLAVASEDFRLSLEKKPSMDEAKERLKEAQAAADKELAEKKEKAGDKPVSLDWSTERSLRGAEELVKVLENGGADMGISGEIQAVAIGDFAIVGMPGEIFVKIGLGIVDKSPFARTIAIAHTNGSIGYVPTSDQVPLGGYEVERARARKYGIFIAPDSDQVLIDTSLKALQKCYDSLHG